MNAAGRYRSVLVRVRSCTQIHASGRNSSAGALSAYRDRVPGGHSEITGAAGLRP